MESVGEVANLAAIGVQVAAALQVVHGKRMVHRALKADSIFLTCPVPNPVIKLLDFGVANFTQSVRQSQTGSLLGAPLYMSPEVGRGLGNVDHRADIYSLGCILFEMATGRPPFVREGAGQLIVAHATEAPPAARTLEPSIPVELDDLIGRSLRKDPAQRPQSMGEIVAILGRFSKSAAPAAMPAQASGPAFSQPLAAAPARVVAPVAVPAQMSAPAFAHPVAATAKRVVAPSQPGVATPSASMSQFLQKAAAMSRASITPTPTPSPGVAATGHPRARIPEPTALLRPSEAESSAAPVTLSSQQPSQRSSTGRHQPTALLDPPSQPIAARDVPAKRARRATPAPVEEIEEDGAAASRLPRLPLIAIACAVVVCVVTLVVVLLMRKSPAPKVDSPAATSSRSSAPAREEFQPPSPERVPSAEKPSVDVPARPAGSRVQSPSAAAKAETRPSHSKSHSPGERPGHAKSKDAPRW
jgi:hypothetical protein